MATFFLLTAISVLLVLYNYSADRCFLGRWRRTYFNDGRAADPSTKGGAAASPHASSGFLPSGQASSEHAPPPVSNDNDRGKVADDGKVTPNPNPAKPKPKLLTSDDDPHRPAIVKLHPDEKSRTPSQSELDQICSAVALRTRTQHIKRVNQTAIARLVPRGSAEDPRPLQKLIDLVEYGFPHVRTLLKIRILEILPFIDEFSS